jgi:DNA invertase Pin-like site-specific DNA recombinase
MKKRKRAPEPEAEDDGTRLIGYARVSTAEQNVAAQLEALRRHGVMEDNLHWETISGVKKIRPKLELALKDAREGDTFVVYKLDRLGRSMRDLLAKMEMLAAKGVKFRSLTEGIDTSTPVGNLAFHMIAALAQFERDLIVERTRFGVAAAQRRGVPVGAPPKVPKKDWPLIEKRIRAGESVDTIARSYDVTTQTIYRRFPRAKLNKLRRGLKSRS